jgi:hypothetical protein
MTPDQPNDEERSEEQDWQRLVTEQFFKGYAESDSIYDSLPTTQVRRPLQKTWTEART